MRTKAAAQGPLAQRLRGLDDGLQMLKTELGARLAARRRCSSSRSSAARSPSTARAARITARPAARSSSAAPSPAAACSPTGPGSRARDLHEGRDLRATTDLRALFKAVLHERFGVGEAALARTVFPASDAVEPLEG